MADVEIKTQEPEQPNQPDRPSLDTPGFGIGTGSLLRRMRPCATITRFYVLPMPNWKATFNGCLSSIRE